MKRILFILLIVASMASLPSLAQQRRGERAPISPENREKWLAEMRSYKHDFLVKELELTQEQQNAFFPIYDEMDSQLNKISEETRQLETKVANDENATDTEIELAAKAVFEQKGREGLVEASYFDKFKETLTPKQLLRLKNAERKFTQQLVKHHGRMRQDVQRKQ